MAAKRFLICLLAILASPAALAQPRGDDVRGTVPPGSAADGSRPSDGAIQGGSILPGEVGGAPSAGRGSTTPRAGAPSRCEQLTGTLREQCLMNEQAASSGANREPRDADGAEIRGPRTDPPPTTPR